MCGGNDESLLKDAKQSEARKKFGVNQSMKEQFTIKKTSFLEKFEKFPVLSKFVLAVLSWQPC